MTTTLITEKYEEEISGVLECFDRVVLSDNLQPLCYAKGMTKYLYMHWSLAKITDVDTKRLTR